MPPQFFATPAAFRAWLHERGAAEPELLVGFVKTDALKRDPSKPSLTYKQAVDAALCYGWIDGVRRNVDEERYAIRFTPRKAKSNWSAVNITRVGELTALGVMTPAGVAAFARREESRSRIYSYENRPRTLPPEYEKPFKKNPKAWAFFQTQAPSQQRTRIYWVVSAVKEETRRKRLQAIIDDCANQLRWENPYAIPAKARRAASSTE
jgi:uncharacterized protein YdeI (YjbR/CyaY-like superfamily)